jgi:hydroxyacylglutathione hydrolase
MGLQEVAEGITVVTSRYWRTNSGLIRTENGVVVVDAGVLPDEMRALAVACGGSPIIAGISTHEHWDHLLWSAALGVDVPRYASSAAVSATAADRSRLLRRLEREEEEWGVRWDRDRFGRVLAHDLGSLVGCGAPSLDLIDLSGHAAGQIGVWVAGADVLFAADTVSDIDPPALPEGLAGVHTYLETLARMLDLVGAARVVVPGHGTPCNGLEAKRRLDLDRRYLDTLLDVVQREDGSRDKDSVVARVAEAVDDGRLATRGGRLLHEENVRSLLRG